ncbi:MAG: hypothetical protein ACE14L_15215 [Terriglobales bacterium]
MRGRLTLTVAYAVRAMLVVALIPCRFWARVLGTLSQLDQWSGEVVRANRYSPTLTQAIQSGKVILFPRRYTA